MNVCPTLFLTSDKNSPIFEGLNIHVVPSHYPFWVEPYGTIPLQVTLLGENCLPHRLFFASRIFVSNFSLENISTVDWLSSSIHFLGMAALS